MKKDRLITLSIFFILISVVLCISIYRIEYNFRDKKVFTHGIFWILLSQLVYLVLETLHYHFKMKILSLISVCFMIGLGICSVFMMMVSKDKDLHLLYSGVFYTSFGFIILIFKIKNYNTKD